MSRIHCLLALSVLLLFPSCRLPAKTPQLQEVVSTSAPLPTAAAEEEISIELPTAVLAAVEVPADVIIPDSLEVPALASDPLRFVFPTPAPGPVSAWRPPLYPVPWAPSLYDHFFFSRPIAADEINWPLADYRYGGVFLPGVVHTGIDIPVKMGTPVLAAGAGRVTWAGYGLYRGMEDPEDPYGLAVTIKHDFGYQGETLYTVYGHLDRIDVAVGQHVEAGEDIGLSGDTGNVTGPHLHFEVRVGRNNYFVSRNPELWLAPPQGWGILAARITNSTGYLIRSHQLTIISEETGQTWYVKSYGQGTVNSDPFYRENLVIGDLPAGDYVVWVPYEGYTYNADIRIEPGMVSYLTFRGKNGIKTGPPPTPAVDFISPDATPTPTP